ncbi:MAG: ATP-dependent DNA helicase RecG [Candidatus Collierbacteria bacterium GW2011_GWC2_44_18]|uniref:ATP-dependent DNA helicase RecG n=1 Tax=Candidatus Collierbacteria bacterium GW2011_GWC2_44_18 TaxID=1618392 RepID=A0A0G1HR74_9BACT|nr:MAG: ATP-dependent DNA helicase RecG [Microgenomates group bacterium GW2011_GWC1_44_10]KKT49440.1 MAG: ATP-dependent DNA helicase RecG [Candidatus Collierbacteria bacterium GW2011_GWC2_44_18]
MNPYSPGDSVSSVKGIGPAMEERLHRLQIYTVGDLLRHFPRTYLDFSKQVMIKDLRDKTPSSFLAAVNSSKTFYSVSGKLITQSIAQDSSGKITLTWFNNPYIKRLIKDRATYSIAGKPSFFGKGLTLISPIIEEGDSFTLNTKGLVPVYPQTEGINSRWLRKKIHELLQNIDLHDPVDTATLDENALLPLQLALYRIHFPTENKERWSADKRLAYNEHLRINIQNRLELDEIGHSIPLKITTKIDTQTSKLLPFTITSDQQKTIHHLEKDLKSGEFTHRLIQGETGSGKTAPLFFAANQALASGYSSAVLVPTEILATQHFHTFLKYSLFPKQVNLVTSSSKFSLTSEPTLFIGTHALLNQLPPDLNPPLLFVAIDEQHKFGVTQREILMKRKPLPHIFNLSATPIPRTVALGLLGDIAISNIRHKPNLRMPVKTFVITPTKFKNSPTWLISELEKGNQIFVVCPNISEHFQGVSSVEKMTSEYRRFLPNKFPIWSIHGKLTPEAQQHILFQFKNTPGSVLISTSLIEVGIDIPAANIMVVHSAERFGLAQLHQLRGRVGRGEEQGFCFLVPSNDDETETERLQLLQKYHTGMVLAQKDLRLRGAGQIYGEKQHGYLQTRLKYFWSKKLFLKAKSDALKLIRQNRRKAQEIASGLISW